MSHESNEGKLTRRNFLEASSVALAAAGVEPLKGLAGSRQRTGRALDNPNLFGPSNRETPDPPRAVEFLPRAAHDGAAIGVPSLARGLYALQAKMGVSRAIGMPII